MKTSSLIERTDGGAKIIASSIDSLADQLVSNLVIVADGYTYRNLVAEYITAADALAHQLFPEPLRRADGSVNRGYAPSTLGKLIPTEEACKIWYSYLTNAALRRGAKDSFAGVKNYLCGSVMPH